MATQEKIAAVSELKELFEASNAVILTADYHVSLLHSSGSCAAHSRETRYAVVKNTLALSR